MKGDAMRKTAAILFLGVCALALIGLCIVQHQKIQRLSASRAAPGPAIEAPATASVAAVESAAPATEGKPAPRIAVAERSEKEALSRARPAQAEAEAARPAGRVEAEAAGEPPMAGIARMMKNPGMRDMIRAQQKGQMDLMFGQLFKYLQLPDADLEAFKDLLLDKQMALAGISLDAMGAAKTEEERKAAAERIKTTIADFDARIKEFLGDDDFAVYRSYEETQPDRMQVTMFKGALKAGDALTEDQEDSLIRAMHEERTNFHFSVRGFGDNQLPNASQFTPDMIAKMLEESAKLQEKYVSRAAAILTPSQIEQFRTSQQEQRAMQEMGIKMAAKMFGQPDAKAAGDKP
jgi:hypothetical protein